MLTPNPTGVDVDPSAVLPGGVVNGSYVATDKPAPGLTTGVTWTIGGKLKMISDPAMCIQSKTEGMLSLSGSVSYGKYGFTIGGMGNVDKETCSTPKCDYNTGAWSCAAPSGSHNNWGFNVFGRGQVQIPLDTNPYLKPFCQGSWAVKLGLGVSCNLDLSAGISYSQHKSEAQGMASCGSGCEHGEATSGNGWSVNLDGSGTLEVEFALGYAGNGRVGINVDGSYNYSTSTNTSCDGNPITTSDSCLRSTARMYVSGCAGNIPGISYCFNWQQRFYRINSGNCPPDTGDDSPGDSAGTSAGNSCAASVTFFDWATKKAQCYNCCNGLPAPPPEVQGASAFDADCKAVCDAEPWNN